MLVETRPVVSRAASSRRRTVGRRRGGGGRHQGDTVGDSQLRQRIEVAVELDVGVEPDDDVVSSSSGEGQQGRLERRQQLIGTGEGGTPVHLGAVDADRGQLGEPDQLHPRDASRRGGNQRPHHRAREVVCHRFREHGQRRQGAGPSSCHDRHRGCGRGRGHAPRTDSGTPQEPPRSIRPGTRRSPGRTQRVMALSRRSTTSVTPRGSWAATFST